MIITKHILACTLAVGLAAPCAIAADHHVPSQFTTIQAAIDAASPGDTVIVADGVYTGAGNRNLSFGGKSITVRSVNGPAATIISVQAAPDHPACGFLFISGETPAAVLDGFTIRGGSTPPGAIADEFNGGAILCNASSPTIRNCILTENNCGCWGGAICCTNASPTIEGCRIIGNHADDDGGGLFAWNNSSPTIRNTVIAGNDTVSFGGGVALFSGTSEIVNCTIVGNVANNAGGLYAFGGTIRNSIVRGNAAEQIFGGIVTDSNIEGGHEGHGNIDVDPMFVDAANGDYRLTVDSPLVDAGNLAYVPAGTPLDFEGDPRVIGAGVDIGADELRCAADFDASGTLGFGDLNLLLSRWGACAADCAWDLDLSGAVGFGDLNILLAGWGPCP